MIILHLDLTQLYFTQYKFVFKSFAVIILKSLHVFFGRGGNDNCAYNMVMYFHIKRRQISAIFAVCAVVLAGGCRKKEKVGEKLTGEMSDMSTYTNFQDQETHVFYDLTIPEMAQAMGEKKTSAVYFGYDTCEWCLDAVPVINDAAKATENVVGYINTRKDPSWEHNTDMEDYDLLVEKIGGYLDFDASGKRKLYVPMLFFIKDGKVVATHEGTLEGHNAKNRAMTAEEREELRLILVDKFAMMAEQETKK